MMLFAYERHFTSLFKNKPPKKTKEQKAGLNHGLKRRRNKWEVECLFNDRSALSVQMRSRLIRNNLRWGGGGGTLVLFFLISLTKYQHCY